LFSIDLLHCSKGEVVYSFPDEPIMQNRQGWNVMLERVMSLTEMYNTLIFNTYFVIPAKAGIFLMSPGFRLSPE